jgi:hypothetical protein
MIHIMKTNSGYKSMLKYRLVDLDRFIVSNTSNWQPIIVMIQRLFLSLERINNFECQYQMDLRLVMDI